MKKLIKKGLYFTTVFSLVVWSTGLTPISHSLATALPDENDCELVVTKSDDGYDPIMPGQELVYHLTIQNIGEDECTGDEGVFLKDFYDANTSYVSDTLGGVVDHNGYLKWNLGVVNPSQIIELDLTMLVNPDTQCGSILENDAMWWFSTQ